MPKRKGTHTGLDFSRRVAARIERRAEKQGVTEGKQLADLFAAKPNFWTRRRKGEVSLTVAEVYDAAKKLGNEPWLFFLDLRHRKALRLGMKQLMREEMAIQAGPSDASPSARSAKRGAKGAAK